MSRIKLAPKPKTFYICDRLCECYASERCGKKCIHTEHLDHALYSEHRHFAKHKDGSLWEKEKKYAK